MPLYYCGSHDPAQRHNCHLSLNSQPSKRDDRARSLQSIIQQQRLIANMPLPSDIMQPSSGSGPSIRHPRSSTAAAAAAAAANGSSHSREPDGIMRTNSNSSSHRNPNSTTTAAAAAAATAANGAQSYYYSSHLNRRSFSSSSYLWWCRVTVWIGVALAAYQVLWSYFLAGYNIPDVEIDKLTGQKRIRRRPDKLHKHDPITHQEIPTYVQY